MVNPGKVFWTGQHWINYLRVPGAKEDSGQVSVWHIHYCVVALSETFIEVPS